MASPRAVEPNREMFNAKPLQIGLVLEIGLVLAQSLLCEHPTDAGLACNACASCHYVAAGQHPDLRLVEPVDVEEDGTLTPTEWIAVDKVRALIDWAQLTSHRRVAKVGCERSLCPRALHVAIEAPPQHGRE